MSGPLVSGRSSVSCPGRLHGPGIVDSGRRMVSYRCSVHSVGLVTRLFAGVSFLRVLLCTAASSEFIPNCVVGLHLRRGTGVASMSARHLEVFTLA